jgi:hypothetical protein
MFGINFALPGFRGIICIQNKDKTSFTTGLFYRKEAICIAVIRFSASVLKSPIGNCGTSKNYRFTRQA